MSALWHRQRTVIRLALSCTTAVAGIAGCEGPPPAPASRPAAPSAPSAPSAPGTETPWDAARRSGVEFRAIGQEPGWSLEIDQGRTLRYTGDYGNTTITAPAPETVHDSTGAVMLHARAEAHEIVVMIRETVCQDVMSGEEFSHTVALRVDGRELQGCGRTLPTGELTGTYWRLTELDGEAAIPGSPSREAHLRLIADGAQATGSTGCNSMMGPYHQSGDSLRFGPLAMTRMACIDPAANQQEQSFVRTLGEVDRFTVGGDSLTLYSRERASARFTAGYLR